MKIWIGVDADGSAWAYRLKPEWNATIGGGSFFRQENDLIPVLVRGKNKAHAGKCWQQEIAPPKVAKEHGTVPPFAERGDEAALRKHEKDPFR